MGWVGWLSRVTDHDCLFEVQLKVVPSVYLAVSMTEPAASGTPLLLSPWNRPVKVMVNVVG